MRRLDVLTSSSVQRDKNKALEGKIRDAEKKLVEEKGLRESAEAKVRALRKALKEKVESVSTAVSGASQSNLDDSPNGGASISRTLRIEKGTDEHSTHAPLSRASSTDSLEHDNRTRKLDQENQAAPVKEDSAQKIQVRTDDSRTRNASLGTPPRPANPPVAGLGTQKVPVRSDNQPLQQRHK